MLWTKSILAIAGSYGLLIMTAQAEERRPISIPLYQCPAYLQLDSQSYALDLDIQGGVFDGPIEEMGALKPEPIPDDDNVEPSFWDYGDYRDADGNPPVERPLYLKCRYKDTGHYLVLKMQGAYRCTVQKGAPILCE